MEAPLCYVAANVNTFGVKSTTLPTYHRLRHQFSVYFGRMRLALSRRTLPRPDFLDADVVLEEVTEYLVDNLGGEVEEVERFAHFPDHSAAQAVVQGWCRRYDDYLALAAFVFALRYPGHPYSRNIRDAYPDMTDADIARLAAGTLVIAWPND